MKDIRIFVASSKELERERNYLAFLVLAKEDELAARGLRVRLAKWEYVDPKMTEARTEDRYLDEMYNCDAALVLFRDIAGIYTREELDKALAREQTGSSRLKTHQILFAADGKPGSDAAKLRESLPPDSYGVWSDMDELRDAFLSLVDKVAQYEGLADVPSDKYIRKITAFLAADEELAIERNAFADTVLNVNDLLEHAHRNIRVQLKFYAPANAESVIESSEMGLVLYGTNYRMFGIEEIKRIYERVKDGTQNPKRFYVFFRDLDEAAEKTLDEAFKTFRSNFVSKLGHFICQFGDANALRLGFLLSLERYAGESIEIYSTVSAPTTPVFVGRENELRRLCGLLESVPGKFPAGRLPVITGAGGTGKSELVRQYASQRRIQYAGGVFQVDMEHIKTWEEAFLGILKGTPNNGVKVEEYLDLKEEAGADEERSGEPMTGAKVRDALLRRARESGPVLLVLDNVEGCMLLLGRDGGFRKAFPAGFSERVRVNVVATARVCDVVLRETDWAVPFPLGDLSQDAALEVLLADRPEADAAERKAAGRVAELLGYRALYLRRVPALIGDLYAQTETVCDSYAELANALEENLLETVAEETEDTHLPGVLWNMTRERLLNMPLGAECVKLAQVASFFSPDGFPRHILKHLWKTVVAPNLDDKKFVRALEILKHHNVFQSVDPVRIHRLDRAAIQESITDGSTSLEDEIGRTLAGYLGMSPKDWLLFSDNLRILSHIPARVLDVDFSVITDTGSRFRSLYRDRSYLWTELLMMNGETLEYHPWERLDGADWSLLLSRRPGLANMCAWEKLSGSDWVTLLSLRSELVDIPELEKECRWKKLDGRDWATLLSAQPQFASKCAWEKLSGQDWATLLSAQPQLACHAKTDTWKKLDGNDWSVLLGNQFERFKSFREWDKLISVDCLELLAKQPQLSKRFPLGAIQESNDIYERVGRVDTTTAWFRLLRAQPQFDVKCPWDMLDGNSWEWLELLEAQPKYFDKCPKEIFDGWDWGRLLRAQPQLSERCPWEKLSGRDWASLLQIQPQFFSKCPVGKLKATDWSCLLEAQPQLYENCPWGEFNGHGWARLLRSWPQFFEKCQWEKLDASDWVTLLIAQPQFYGLCKYEKLNGSDWVELLEWCPQLGDKRSWVKLNGSDWAELLCKHPDLHEECKWELLSGSDWVWLLESHPEFSGKCDWSKIVAAGLVQSDNMSSLDLMDMQCGNRCGKYYDREWADWIQLLCRQPDFAFKHSWPWEDVSNTNWVRLLVAQTRFADGCPWEKLDGKDWSLLLTVHPQFKDQCRWEKLKGSDWTKLLCQQPDLHKECKWELLSGSDWVHLLSCQPQFKDQCRWEKLKGSDWAELLCQQPDLHNKECKWELLSGSDWVHLLSCQPQFKDYCRWAKIDFDYRHGWVDLLCRQPQFAEKCPKEKLKGDDWSRLLQERPDFSENFNWDLLDGSDWASLLCRRVQFANKCQWEKLTGSDWAELLCEQPRFANECKWEKLNGSDWAELLGKQFRFFEMCTQQCGWDKMDGSDWASLLIRSQWDISDEGANRDRLMDYLKEVRPWNKLNGTDWARLLGDICVEYGGQLTSICPWEKLSSWDWACLLSRNPEFASEPRCPWDKFESDDWAKLIANQPQFAERCPWGLFDGRHWAFILSFAKDTKDLEGRCPWNLLSGWNWAVLLSRSPKFAGRCNWELFDGFAWERLLREQPGFLDQCPWKALWSIVVWKLLFAVESSWKTIAIWMGSKMKCKRV